ncbi:MAG: cytochrome c3 family protein [Planctomycetota bacterium]
MQTRISVMGVVLALVVLLVGTSSVFAQVTACTDCHNDTTVITGKKTSWSESMHGTGEAYGRGTRSSCAACHSGGAFSAMVAAGLTPDTVEAGDPNPTRQDCRACHQIHTSYTAADWVLETTAPVALYALEGVTFDGGKGNLCANCHQPRRTITRYVDDPNGVTNVSSTHWGPHHGPQSAMLLGLGGAGDVIGHSSAHAVMVRNTCVTCHIGEDDSHTFEAVEDSCTGCHPGTDGFDINGVQTEVEALIIQLRDLLLAKGLLAAEIEYEIGDEGVIEEVVVGYHPVKGTYPTAEASALWNYIMIDIEDGSLGVHNPGYTKALLEASVAALQ